MKSMGLSEFIQVPDLIVIITTCYGTNTMNIRHLILIMLALIISACTSTGPKTPSDIEQPATEETYTRSDLKEALLKIEQAAPGEETSLRLTAAFIAVEIGLADQAEELLEPLVPSGLSSVEDIDYRITRAAIKLGNDLPKLALDWLNSVDADQLNLYPQLAIRWGKVRALTYAYQGDYITSARERIYYDGLLSSSARKHNHEQILQTLIIATPEQLEEAHGGSKNTEFKGWLSLSSLMKQFEMDPFTQLDKLEGWQNEWPRHPASLDLPESLRLLKDIVENQPSHVALMLPLSGNLSAVGKAIRDGVLAFHFGVGHQSGRRPEISFIDTSDVSMEIAYEIALAQGADFIIGPLRREKIEELMSNVSPTIPVLALNRVDSLKPSPQFFQFSSLSPEDDVTQVIDQAIVSGYKHAMALAPDSDWGKRHLSAFQKTWEGEDRTLVKSAYFQTNGNYHTWIKELLGVNRSESRSATLSRTIGTSLEFFPRRRQDLDFIFLVATPDQASSLKPALSFYYAENVPVFSTSAIHDNSEKPINLMDLNDIQFSEMPFKLETGQTLQTQVLTNLPSSKGRLAAFYAIGMDAYHMYPRLHQMQLAPRIRLNGATGILSLDENNIVRRRLMWAQFNEGTVRHLPLLINSSIKR